MLQNKFDWRYTLGTVTTGTWNATAIGATYGGTGQTTYTTGDTLYASASNTLSKLAIGSTNQVLTVVAGVPAWSNIQSATTITDDTSTASTRYINFTSATTGTLSTIYTSSTKLQYNPSTGALTSTSLTPTNALGTAYGGTGLTSFTANGVVYASSTSALATGSALVFDGANLGLGVTPSAWTVNDKAIQFAYGNSFASSSATNFSMVRNAQELTGGWTYSANSFAQLYNIESDGAFKWYNAPSGTAGNAITFTQAMTLNASGNLMLGTTSALGSLTIGNGSGSTSISSYLNAGTGGSFLAGRISGSNTWLVGDTYAAIGSGTGMTNYVYGANPWIVYTNSSERARIDSSGNLLVGTTSISAPTTGFTAGFSGSYAYTQIAHPTGTGSGANYNNFLYNGSSIGSITQSGTTAVLYNTTSDHRLKENIQDAASASSLIDALQVRQFDWKSDNSHQRYGFIAQELVTVAPEAVHQPADPEEMMAVDYSKLVPMLVKEIQSLRKRLTALEIK